MWGKSKPSRFHMKLRILLSMSDLLSPHFTNKPINTLPSSSPWFLARDSNVVVLQGCERALQYPWPGDRLKNPRQLNNWGVSSKASSKKEKDKHRGWGQLSAGKASGVTYVALQLKELWKNESSGYAEGHQRPASANFTTSKRGLSPFLMLVAGQH